VINIFLAKLIITVKIDEVFSLKQKRSIVRNIKNYIQKSFNACIAESHDQDSLKYIGFTIGILLKTPDELSSKKETIFLTMEELSQGFIENESDEIL
jgi:uncharacterized protein YlxP (DUF503 family)